MVIVTIHQAQTQLSKLIARAEAGEEIVIARGRELAVKLTPVARQAPKTSIRSDEGFMISWTHFSSIRFLKVS